MHRHLVNVLDEVAHGVEQRVSLSGCSGPAEVALGAAPPKVAERGALRRIRDDDEVPILGLDLSAVLPKVRGRDPHRAGGYRRRGQ
jgi:hypothetical protein